MGYCIEDFSLDLRKSVAPPNHIWVSSGSSTCAPLAETVMGVRGCFSPPFAAPDIGLSVGLNLNGHPVEDTGNRGKGDCGLLFAGSWWRPDRIKRAGTYHFMTEAGLLCVGVVSRLAPLREMAGFLLEAEVENRTQCPMVIQAEPALTPGRPGAVPLEKWEFMPPAPETEEAVQTAENQWESDSVRVTLLREQEGENATEPGSRKVFRFAVILTDRGVNPVLPRGILGEAEKTEAYWRERVQALNSSVPEIRSSLPGLEAYCRRSLISGLVCLWDHPDFVVSPFPATSGIDGGSLCCYPWDGAGYSAQTLVMLLGEGAGRLLLAMLRSGIDSHISMSLNGRGLGWCSYSYSMWSILNLYWVLVTMLDTGWELFGEIRDLFLKEEERLPEWEHLKDYGRQHNLLEMRGSGYEYFVPSPNAERAWCYDRLADLAERLGEEAPPRWREKAELIRNSIRENLWDAEKRWFFCRHPEGRREYVYSIQCFDPLRMGACTPEMKEGLLLQVRDGAFLGDYGVSSVSAEDALHYELNDPDWSGGGSYTGEGPNLAEMLWQAGEPGLAWEVISRHFWMGRMLPYFPQEHYCDRPGVPANKRANIISGVAGFQAVLFGMAGICPQLDGSLRIAPHPPGEGFVEVLGYRHRGVFVDIRMEPGWVRVSQNGELVYEGEPKEITL